MGGILERIFARYGGDGVISGTSGERQIRLFFHPVNSRSWQNMERMFSPLGEVPRGQYVAILPAGCDAAVDNTLATGGKEYLLRRVEPMRIGGQILYLWALCVEKGGQDLWAQNG